MPRTGRRGLLGSSAVGLSGRADSFAEALLRRRRRAVAPCNGGYHEHSPTASGIAPAGRVDRAD